MRPTRLLAPLAVAAMLFGLGACHIELLGDLEVAWTYNGSDNTAACAKHNIAKWRVELRGPEILSWEQSNSCETDAWDTGVDLHGIVEGTYAVTVLALDASGKELASKARSAVDVIGIGPRISINFTDADFNTSSGKQVNVYWNINGTVNGQAKGQSWDTCDEVGATDVVVLVDGKENKFKCKGMGGSNTMSASVAVDAKPVVQVKLVDGSGAALTTMSPKSPGPNSVDADTWEYVAEFYYDAFSAKKNGVYSFKTTFEGGKTCSQLTPKADLQVALLKLSGTPITADVCDASSTCVKTNGADTLPCTAGTQQLSSLEWGEYEMKLSGATGPAPGTICWEQEFKKQDMLIGAGDTNPVVTLDLPKTITTGACQ